MLSRYIPRIDFNVFDKWIRGTGLGSSVLKMKIDPHLSEMNTLYLSSEETIPVNSNELGSKSIIILIFYSIPALNADVFRSTTLYRLSFATE